MFAIGTVAAQLGISPDVLRKWEARHGWPVPRRIGGKRRYDAEQLRQLQTAQRLMNSGHPVALALELARGEVFMVLSSGRVTPDVSAVLELALAGDFAALRGALYAQRAQLDDTTFIEGFAAPLMHAVGRAWSAGQLRVWQEHAISAMLQEILVTSSGVRHPEPRSGRPLALLTTPPGERHTLGLEMARQILLNEGIACIALGAETPLEDLGAAARDSGADIVGLSVSCAFPARAIHAFARAVRKALPSTCALWLGGAGASLARTRTQQDIAVCCDTATIRRELARRLPCPPTARRSDA